MAYRRTPKLGGAGTLLSRDGKRGYDPRETYMSLPHKCYNVKFGSSATQSVRINRRKPSKLGSARTPPPWGGGVAVP